MKIGVNSRVYQQAVSGIPYYIKNLYSKLYDVDKNNEYVFFQTETNRTLGKTVVSRSSGRGINGAFFDLFGINRLIKREKINVLHGASFILPNFPVEGIKYVVTVHDLAFLRLRNEPNDYSWWYYFYSKYGIGRSIKMADIVVADSHNTKKDIVELYNTDPDKIKVVHLGINEEVTSNKNGLQRIIKDEYFFSVSTNPRRKNTLSVLRAMAKSKKLSGLKYVIAGLIPDVQKRELQREIERLKLTNRVIIFGYAEEKELGSLYRNANFFIYPSFYEGFGFPVVEAMACGCPVITSNNSSLTELTPDKEWLVDPYRVFDIRDKMEKMVVLGENKRRGLIEKNLKFSSRFSWRKTALEMMKIFNDLRNGKD